MTTRSQNRPDNTGGKQGRGQFKPGVSGNPDGKPRGARHRVTLAVEALLEGDAEKLTRKAIELALAGDSTALRLCLERIAPAPKDRPISFALPPVVAAADVSAAIASIIGAVAEGSLTPSEGTAMVGMVEKFRSAFELEEIERRLRALEDTK